MNLGSYIASYKAVHRTAPYFVSITRCGLIGAILRPEPCEMP